MKSIFIILIPLLIAITHSLMFQTTYKEHCFEKVLEKEDMILINYMVTSDKEENIHVRLKGYKSFLFDEENKQSGEYRSDLLRPGKYKLCFKNENTKPFYISFDFFAFSETGLIKDLAQDKEVKQMSEGVNQLTNAMNDFEGKLRNIIDRRSRHTIILKDIIKSIKGLTFLKIGIIALISILQVFIIQKFFGPNKSLMKVRGAGADSL